jgi:isopentenyl phosphate kinase
MKNIDNDGSINLIVHNTINMKKELTFIKLGGSVITNKDIPMSLRADVLTRLVDEIAKAYQENHDEMFVIGHGQGSFAHVPAQEYKTMEGFVSENSRFGMAVVQDNAAQLNRIVVHEFIRRHLPAVSLYPSNTIVTKKRNAHSFCTDILEQYLELDMMPITGGDVIADYDQGCTIWSTEEVLAFFAEEFAKKGTKIKHIIHVTEVPGFLDVNGEVVDEITPSAWLEQKTAVKKTKGFDVTGGMSLKIEESLQLTNLGIESKIISGLEPNNLYNTLTNKNWLGTHIFASEKQTKKIEESPAVAPQFIYATN